MTLRAKITFGIVILTVSIPAHADIGVPMVFVTLPGMLAALVPIIAIESFVLLKRLTITKGFSIKVATIGNLASTILGIPLSWCALALIQMLSGGGSAYGLDTWFQKLIAVTWQAPWLIPYESDLRWMVPAATLTLLIPFFFASWWIEFLVAKRIFGNDNQPNLKVAIRDANLMSYCFLAIVVLGVLVHSLATKV